MQSPIHPAILLAIGALVGAGCSKQEFQVARVSGTVTCGGQTLTEGMVVFTPIGTGEKKTHDTGRSASGLIQEDGSFELTTYRRGDGAIVGTHTISVFAPPPIDDDAPITDTNRFACGKTPLEETVGPGDNYFELELTPPPPSKTSKSR
ncbi:hypothetical protein [Schlesneria sp. T3-172]|uniref:hypothetical protein n=1 Tax=Schlesneria sphaerica TaxID=3373610 RepID=UPI0037C74D12